MPSFSNLAGHGERSKKVLMLGADREKNAMKDSRGPWREWETDGYGVVQWSSERCDGTRRQGRMSPGRQPWGCRAWDGSALKNTSVPPLPACAPLPLKLLFSPSSVVYSLHLISLFPRPLLSVPSLFKLSHHISSSLPSFLFSIGGTSSSAFYSGTSKKAIYSSLCLPFLSPKGETAKILWPLAGF